MTASSPIARIDDAVPRANTVFILLSYKRPQNMRRLIEPILASGLASRILLSNNNPEVDIASYLGAELSGVELICQSRPQPAAKRFEIAREIDAEKFIALDDDIFLDAAQLQALLRALLADPSVPHGIWGQRLQVQAGRPFLRSGYCNIDGEVDVLNRVYAFTRLHVESFFALLGALDIGEAAGIGPADDIVLSFAGEGRPRCHDLGAYRTCPTTDAPGIALWREAGFSEHRLKVFARLLRLAGDRRHEPCAEAPCGPGRKSQVAEHAICEERPSIRVLDGGEGYE